jgi:hypothetical protein
VTELGCSLVLDAFLLCIAMMRLVTAIFCDNIRPLKKLILDPR